jgi:hypothetical protein
LAAHHFESQNFGWELNRWYHLKLVASKDHFGFYIDGKLMLEYVDGMHAAGKVAIGGAFKMTTAHFDNVVISGPNIPNGGPGLSPVQLRSKLTTTWGHIKRAD